MTTDRDHSFAGRKTCMPTHDGNPNLRPSYHQALSTTFLRSQSLKESDSKYQRRPGCSRELALPNLSVLQPSTSSSPSHPSLPLVLVRMSTPALSGASTPAPSSIPPPPPPPTAPAASSSSAPAPSQSHPSQHPSSSAPPPPKRIPVPTGIYPVDSVKVRSFTTSTL